MGFITLLKAGIRKQKGSVFGVFTLIFMVSLCLVTALAVWVNSGSYIDQEMSRLGFGDITAWVSDIKNPNTLAGKIKSLDDVDKVGVQPLIFAGYSIGGTHSDDEGELLPYDAASYSYRFINDNLNGYKDVSAINPGEIYISPSLRSDYNVSIGDQIHFELSRDGGEKVFVVKGYFEDPFMGSSMIDMKSFLISAADFHEISGTLSRTSDFDLLGKSGAMLHIYQKEGSALSASDFNNKLNQNADFAKYTKFVHSYSSIYGFMLILQNIFTGFLLAFAIILIAVAMVMIGHSISNAIEQDYRDIGILKTFGCTTARLRLLQMTQYGIGITAGMLAGLLCSAFVVGTASRLTVTSTGLFIPVNLPYRLCFIAFAAVLVILALFIYFKTKKIGGVSPVYAISNMQTDTAGPMVKTPIRPAGLRFHLAVRQLVCGKKRYLGICIVAALLVFFTSIVGRMNTWLGPNGEGLMNAFSVADFDIGVQPMRSVNMKDVENMISSYSPNRETYQIAMQNITVNGVDYTVNVLDRPQRFHLLTGKTCTADNQVVITEFVAKDLGIGIGGRVTVAYRGNHQTYTVSGIYECANQMGANIGMSREGFAKIGDVNAYIWCHHYLLADGSASNTVMKALQSRYRTQLAVHTNRWSGLDGIVGTLHLLILFMYAVAVVLIFVVVALTGSKLLRSEQHDMAIYKSLGFTPHDLRLSFSIRFGIVVTIGAVIGAALSGAVADPTITLLLRPFGIGRFVSSFEFLNGVLPPLGIILLFVLFAYLSSGKIKKADITALISD